MHAYALCYKCLVIEWVGVIPNGNRYNVLQALIQSQSEDDINDSLWFIVIMYLLIYDNDAINQLSLNTTRKTSISATLKRNPFGFHKWVTLLTTINMLVGFVDVLCIANPTSGIWLLLLLRLMYMYKSNPPPKVGPYPPSQYMRLLSRIVLNFGGGLTAAGPFRYYYFTE